MAQEIGLVIGNKGMVYLFLLIPLIIVLHFIFLRHSFRRAMKFSNFQAMKRVEGGKIRSKYFTPLFFMLIIVCLLIVAMMEVRVYYPGKISGSDYYLLLDSGSSMTARDVYPDRFGFAKQIAEMLITNLSDSKKGFISFGGSIDESVSLTDDEESLRKALISSDISDYGTDIGLAIVASIEGLKHTNRSKTVILISDGHDTVGIPLSDAIRRAQEENVKIITIGVGTSEGGVFLNVPDSQQIISKIDEDNLRLLANSTGGTYLLIKEINDINQLMPTIMTSSKEGYLTYDITPICMISALMVLFFWWVLENTRFRIFP